MGNGIATRSKPFFRLRLLQCNTQDDIIELLNAYRAEADQIVDEITMLTLFMQGGITRQEAFVMSGNERRRTAKVIQEGYKTLAKINGASIKD